MLHAQLTFKTAQGASQAATDTGMKDERVSPAGPDSGQNVPKSAGAYRQSPGDAWWTGSMLAAGAGTLPPGHFLIEPYLYAVTVPHSNTFGSFNYIIYGLADRLSVGMIPTAGYTRTSEGLGSSGVGLGDQSLMAQYRLTKTHSAGGMPTMSVNVEETFPTGKYDRLGNRPDDGFGSGAYTTTLALYTQQLFWLPNGRLMRMRLNTSLAFSTHVNIEDVSVYGTSEGFRGQAVPGRSVYIDAAWEYSLTRSWVPALDITYRHNGNTRVTGYNMPESGGVQNLPGIRLNSGTSDAFAFAPGIEYNWTSKLGVLLATRIIPAGHNTIASITPAVAINIFY
jgi:hypothetical protein